MNRREKVPGHNTGLAKVAVQCSADTFVVNQTLILRINICGENRHLRQARKRYAQYQETPYEHRQSDKKRQKSQRFVKLKEVQANTQSQSFCTTFNFTPTHPSPPTTQREDKLEYTNLFHIWLLNRFCQ